MRVMAQFSPMQMQTSTPYQSSCKFYGNPPRQSHLDQKSLIWTVGIPSCTTTPTHVASPSFWLGPPPEPGNHAQILPSQNLSHHASHPRTLQAIWSVGNAGSVAQVFPDPFPSPDPSSTMKPIWMPALEMPAPELGTIDPKQQAQQLSPGWKP